MTETKIDSALLQLQAISAKIKRIVGQFDGQGNIEQFLGRIQVATEMFGEKTTVGAMPFVLEDRAFSVFAAMSQAGRQNLLAVTSRLREVFGLDPIEATIKLKNERYIPGEPVDVLMNRIRQQIRSMKLGNEAAEERLVQLQFIASLPSELQVVCRMKIGTGSITVEDLLALVSSAVKTQGSCAMAEQSATNDAATLSVVNHCPSSSGLAAQPTPRSQRSAAGPTAQCTHCGRIGHFIKDCRMKRGTCFNCGKPGHFARQCTERKSGNECAELSARTVSAQVPARR